MPSLSFAHPGFRSLCLLHSASLSPFCFQGIRRIVALTGPLAVACHARADAFDARISAQSATEDMDELKARMAALLGWVFDSTQSFF